MKNEIDIAKANVESYKKDNLISKVFGQEHLASCQRFLEFLDGFIKKDFNYLNNKIKDLQNAIKIYNEAGIK